MKTQACDMIVCMKTESEKNKSIPAYNRLAAALNNIPESKTGKTHILVRAGKYAETVVVKKSGIRLIGEEGAEIIISSNRTAGDADKNKSLSGTWNCAAVTIAAKDFYAENICFENSFDYPANDLKQDNDPAKVKNAQAAALMTTGNSDKAFFRYCVFKGYQDTLFIDAGRSCFDDCTISGHVDFIFGSGTAVFNYCKIVSLPRPGHITGGYVTAPSTDISFPFGFLFRECRLIKADGVPKGSVCLGRPWHPFCNPGANGSALFFNCFMDDHIGKKGYDRISSTTPQGEKIWFELMPDSRLFEYGSRGPGAMISPERPQLQPAALPWYTPKQVLNGWEPQNLNTMPRNL